MPLVVHVLFVHKNFPAQFGHLARVLAAMPGWRCTFLSETPEGDVNGIRKLRYRPGSGATRSTHYCSRTFENGIWQCDGVYAALKPLRDELRPDLIVGHSGFGGTLFLHELFPGVPVIGYFEYFYHTRDSDLDFRPEWPPSEANLLRSRARNAMFLLDLEYCAAGYSPTRYQRSLLPSVYQPKVRVLHDGIDLSVWHRHPTPAMRTIAGRPLAPGARLVTYVSRGFESMRGFDIFMQVAKRLCAARPDVEIVAVGSDRVCYGGDLGRIPEKSFREHVLSQDEYDLSRIHFVGRLPGDELAQVLSWSDLHIYLTAPFVLSWSMLNAMACGAVVLGSRTPPVEEFLVDGENGLLADFFSVDELTEKALRVLDEPGAFRHLGDDASRRVRAELSLDVIFPQMKQFFEEVAGGRSA